MSAQRRYAAAVGFLFAERYGLTLSDTGLDTSDLETARRDGESPAELVERIALKYDLDRIDRFW